MGLAKQYGIARDDRVRRDAWTNLPIIWTLTIHGEFVGSRVNSTIRPVVGEDEIDLECAYEDADVVIYKGLYSSQDKAEAALTAFLSAAPCNHESHVYQDWGSCR